jgi:hypothetical protein
MAIRPVTLIFRGFAALMLSKPANLGQENALPFTNTLPRLPLMLFAK